jgi:hypothetical protein
MRINILGVKRGIDHEGRPMHPLRGAKDRIGQGMGNHDVIANFDGKHGAFLFCMAAVT